MNSTRNDLKSILGYPKRIREVFRDYDVRELDYKKNILLICGDLFIRYEDKIELIEKAYEVYEMEVYE